MERASGVELADGADFLPTFEGYVREYRAWITPRREDLLSFRWTGGPVEILFVDAAKSWQLLDAILDSFGDSIVPKRTRVVFQDFRYHGTHWLPLVVGSRPDVWREVENVLDGTTVTFRTLRPLRGPGGIRAEYSDAFFSLETSERILRDRIKRERPANQVLLLRTLYRKALIEVPRERATSFRQELFAAAGGPLEADVLQELEDVAWFVSWRAWRTLEGGDVVEARRLAEECVAERGDVVPALHLLGRICRVTGELALADRYLTQVVESALASCPYAVLDRAALRIRQDRLVDAERDALLFLDHVRGDEAAVVHAIEVLEEIWRADGRADRGLSVLRQLARDRAGSAVVWACLARVENSLGHATEALEHIGRATALAPDHPVVERCRAELRREPG